MPTTSPARQTTPALWFEIRHDDGDRYSVELNNVTTQGRALMTAVDAAVTRSDLPGLADPVDACRRAVSRRLNQVDHDLRVLCTLLKEAGGPLDVLLEGLT